MADRMMRAVVRTPEGLTVTDHPAPTPAERDVLIAVRAVVITEQDRSVVRGGSSFTGVPGQAFVGVVEQAAGGFKAGERVTASPDVVCGQCDRCLGGLSTHCRELKLMGADRRDGALATFIAAPRTSIARIPASLDDDHAAFAWLAACALQTAHQLTIEGAPYITVLGDGPLGLLTAQALAPLNASVRVIGQRPEHLERCERWGVKHRPLADIGRRSDQDIVVLCTDDADGLSVALSLVRARGTVLVKTTPAGGGPGRDDLARIVHDEIRVLGSRSGSMAEALRALERRELDVVGLIGRRGRMDDAPALLRDDGLAAVIEI